MKLLLTGGSGLIGSAVRAECKKTDTLCLAPVHSAYDLKEPRAVLNMVSYIKPTHVIHLAGRVGGIKANMEHQAEFWRDNMMMNLNMLEACRKYPVERMICCLSTCIFPDDRPHTLNAGNIHDGKPHHSNYGYAYAKRNLDIGCRAYNEQYGTKFMRVMPCNCFGPHDQFNLDKAHVIPALIHKIRLAKDKNEPLEVWGSGTALREFVYSHDVARAILALINYNPDFFSDIPFIISPGVEHTIAEVVGILCALMDFPDSMVRWDKSKPEGQKRKPTDNSRFTTLFPGFKFTPLADALRETVEWFRLNYPTVRN